MILSKEFARRRQQLLRQMPKGSAAIVAAAPTLLRNRDTEYPYRQDSDFYYLTGFNEPEAVLVLIPKRAQGECVLFCRQRDPQKEIWTGRRCGPAGAKRLFGANEAFVINELDQRMPDLLAGIERVYSFIGQNKLFDAQLMGWAQQLRQQSRAGVRAPAEFVALGSLVHEQRLIKSKDEIRSMKQAAKVAAAAHCRAMNLTAPGKMEFEIAAEVERVFGQAGCVPAYPSIVGSGANGCILHYVENRSRLRDGDLLLIDAGAEHELYASDITRTFPVNGRFSPEQLALYELVLEAQYAAIKRVKPGNSWNEPHDAAVRVITRGLLELGLLKGTLKTLIEREDYKKFFMHRTGHWLGMDVHDVGEYKNASGWRVFEPGMVLTVEPGIYVSGGDKHIPRRWWNIGIRIEDDVLVSKDGCEVLTHQVPKEPAEVEALVGRLA